MSKTDDNFPSTQHQGSHLAEPFSKPIPFLILNFIKLLKLLHMDAVFFQITFWFSFVSWDHPSLLTKIRISQYPSEQKNAYFVFKRYFTQDIYSPSGLNTYDYFAEYYREKQICSVLIWIKFYYYIVKYILLS